MVRAGEEPVRFAKRRIAVRENRMVLLDVVGPADGNRARQISGAQLAGCQVPHVAREQRCEMPAG